MELSKTKYIIAFSLAVCTTQLCVFGQNKDSLNGERIGVKSKITHDEAVDAFIARHADSLNNCSNSCTLPYFLERVDFDQHYRTYWPSLHTPFSLRKAIFDRVTNMEVLQRIVNSDNEKYRTNYYFTEIPFWEFSIHDLANYRLQELKNKR